MILSKSNNDTYCVIREIYVDGMINLRIDHMVLSSIFYSLAMFRWSTLAWPGLASGIILLALLLFVFVLRFRSPRNKLICRATMEAK